MKFDFFRNTSGNVALFFAIGLIPILLSAGIAIDYTRLFNARNFAQNAADSAALAAAINSSLSDKGVSEEVDKFFLSNYVNAAKLDSYNVKAVRKADGSVEVTAKGVLPTVFMQFGNFPNMEFKVVSAASAKREKYLNVYLMLDRSASTLIADTDDDVAKLMALTKPWLQAYGGNYLKHEPDGCAFACHGKEPWHPQNKSLLEIAQDNGISMRSSRVVNSAKVMAGQLLTKSNGIKIGLFDFAENSQMTLEPTSDLTKIESLLTDTVPGIKLDGGTLFREAFKNLENKVGIQGKGSLAQPEKMIVLVTDGLYSWWNSANSTENYNPFDSNFCTYLKTSGFQFAVINTIYDPIPNSVRYKRYVTNKGNTAKSKTALQECASQGLYFEANKPGEIENAFKELAKKIINKPIRLLY